MLERGEAGGVKLLLVNLDIVLIAKCKMQMRIETWMFIILASFCYKQLDHYLLYDLFETNLYIINPSDEVRCKCKGLST